MLDSSKIYELNILINGRVITEFHHEGNVFVEGRKGSEFEVEFKNKSNRQVLVVPSVDGKSIFDGKPATAQSRGYVVGPWGSVRVPGWTLDSNAVAKFTFEDKGNSYSAALAQDGEPVVTGVIGVMVYSEKVKPLPVHHIATWPSPYYTGTPVIPSPWPYNGPTWSSTTGQADSSPLRSRRVQAKSSSTMATAQAANSQHENTAMVPDSFDMGAGFGAKADFRTRGVEFERDAVVATLQLYYDSRRNLENRGIQVVKKTPQNQGLPQAFSSTGCTPPPGWQG